MQCQANSVYGQKVHEHEAVLITRFGDNLGAQREKCNRIGHDRSDGLLKDQLNNRQP